MLPRDLRYLESRDARKRQSSLPTNGCREESTTGWGNGCREGFFWSETSLWCEKMFLCKRKSTDIVTGVCDQNCLLMLICYFSRLRDCKSGLSIEVPCFQLPTLH